MRKLIATLLIVVLLITFTPILVTAQTSKDETIAELEELIELLQEAIKEEREAADEIIAERDERIKQLEKQLENNNQNLEEIKQQIRLERKTTDELLDIKNKRIQNLQNQITALESIINDSDTIIENQSKIIEKQNEIILTAEKKFNVMSDINEQIIEMQDQQIAKYQELVNAERRASINVNWYLAILVLGIGVGLYAN